jgi:hypothetical protein
MLLPWVPQLVGALIAPEADSGGALRGSTAARDSAVLALGRVLDTHPAALFYPLNVVRAQLPASGPAARLAERAQADCARLAEFAEALSLVAMPEAVMTDPSGTDVTRALHGKPRVEHADILLRLMWPNFQAAIAGRLRTCQYFLCGSCRCVHFGALQTRKPMRSCA